MTPLCGSFGHTWLLALAFPYQMETTRLSPEMLQRWLIAEEITISFVPTALATPLIDLNWPEKTSLRFLLTGGDTLHRSAVSLLFSSMPKLFLLAEWYFPRCLAQ